MSRNDQLVLERRIRPICDALDTGNPKKAVQEADKILKKHPNTPAAKVLKALALIQTERLGEAITILNEIDVPEANHDESTLSAFIHCYKEAELPERISVLYERVIAKNPTERNLSQLFMSYVITRKFKNQQSVAMRMFKDFGNPAFYFWSVMSVVMQAIENPELGGKLLYNLAEKMFETQIKKSGYSTSNGAGEEIELQEMILDGQGKWKEVIALLESSNASSLPIPPQFMAHKKVKLLQKLQDHSAIRDLAMKQIDDFNDNWIMWIAVIDATLNMVKELNETNPEVAKKELLEFVSYINDQQKTDEEECKTRGPYMAKLEFTKRLADSGLPAKETLEAIGEPVDLIVEFVKRFYTKPSCFNDVKMYLCLLNESQKLELHKALLAFITEVVRNGDEEDKEESKVWVIIVFERLRRAMGMTEKDDAATTRQHVQQLIAQIAQPDRSELAMAALCQLAVTSLWETWRKEDDTDKFYELILLLEFVASRNVSDPICKISLIRAYSHIGNGIRIFSLEKMLDLKWVQHDTLGYLTFPIHEVSGRFEHALLANIKLSMVYSKADREILECLTNAYKNGKFSQVPRLSELAKTMKKSAQTIACDVQNRFLSSLFILDDIEKTINTLYGDEDAIDWNSLLDNRDLTVVQIIQSAEYEKLVDEMKTRTHREFIDITRMRHALCRALGSLGRVTIEGVDADMARNDLKEAVSLFGAHLEYCSREYPSFEMPSRLIQSPSPVLLAQWVHAPGLNTLKNLLNSSLEILAIYDAGKTPSEELIGNLQDFKDEIGKVGSIFSKEKKQTKAFWAQTPISKCSRATQSLAAIQICLQLIKRFVERKGSNSEKATSGKKKKEVLDQSSPIWTRTTKMLEATRDTAKSMVHQLAELKSTLADETGIPSTVAEDFGQTRIVLEAHKEAVDQRIMYSYAVSIENMQTTLNTVLAVRC